MSNLAMLPLGAVNAHELLQAIVVPAALYQGERCIAANDALVRLTGHASTALRELPIAALVRDIERAGLHDAAQACLRDGNSGRMLLARLLTAGGAERQVELHLRPTNIGGTAALMLTCIEQTDIRHAQSSLVAMSQMMCQIVDGAPIAVLVIDNAHRVTHWNSACERMTGVHRSNVIGTRDAWRAFYDSERPMLADLVADGADLACVQRHYANGGNPSAVIPGGFEVEAYLPHFGARGGWLHFTAAPLHDAAGQVIGAIETLQDITERRSERDELLRSRLELERMVQQRSEELAATVRELERFVANAPVGVAYSSHRVIRKVNGAMAAIFGYAPEQMCGMSGVQCCLSADDAADLGRLVVDTLAGGNPLHHEMWMRHADGHPIWVQIDAHRADRDDHRAGIWWMMKDRTELRTAQQQLQARFEELQAINAKLAQTQNQLIQNDKMASIGQLAAGVAHEINNPVGFVSSNLNTLRQHVEDLLALAVATEAAAAAPGDAGAKATLARLRSEVELDYLQEDLPQLLDECAEGLGRVKKIVQDLKDFSRVDQADWQEADLVAGLESTLNVVRNEVKYKAEVVKRFEPLPLVKCLAGQLNQVFLNLIVNAAHAIGERGTITLAAGTLDGWAWVQVDDTGCGMTEEVRRRIFEPFFTTKEVGKGTGLGLSLSFSIVQKHHGTIEVRSTAGVGSSLRVWVPIEGPESVAADATPPSWPEEVSQ